MALAPIVLLAVLVALSPWGGAMRGAGDGEGRYAGSVARSARTLDRLVDEVGDGRLRGSVREAIMAGDVPDVATGVLEAYWARGLVLRGSGYLDLVGRCWACVVWSGEWSEVCVVREGPERGSCEVRTVRIEGSGWEDGNV